MSTKISFGLSPKEVDAAIKQLRQYKSDLNLKCEEFCRRLCEVGAQEAQARISQSPLGKTIKVSTEISPEKTGCKAILFAVGETKEAEGYEPVNTLLLIEFGAGIRYNPDANPKADEYGMGVGTYPGQLHAFDPGGWYYMGEDGEWHHSYGVKATMPMYGASLEMRNRIAEIAKEVFGGG